MYQVSARLVAFALGLVLAHSAFGAETQPVDQPRVVTYGKFLGGGFVFCAGMDCSGAYSAFSNPWLQPDISLSAEGGIDREEFCSVLKSEKPSGCDAANPPSTPGTDPDWAPNGCGTSGYSNLVLDTASTFSIRPTTQAISRRPMLASVFAPHAMA